MSGFTDAPQTIQNVARQIAEGATPDVSGLSQDAINAAYSAPFPDRQPTWGHTLLRQAVQSKNLGAAEALIAAGADVRFNDDEMAYLAVRMSDSELRVWFPDVRTGAAFLRLWYGAGGDPNAINRYYGPLGNLLVSTPQEHLEVILLLLEIGTNPWFRLEAEGGSSSTPYYYESFFETLANASPISSEVSFRIAKAGLMAPGTPEDHARMMKLYQQSAEAYVDAGGSENAVIQWQMQMALDAVLGALNIQPDGAIDTLVQKSLPEVSAGFWLGPDEIRSPEGSAHELRTDNQFGQEMWNDR